MNILISNDDGVLAPGIQALKQALKNCGRVIVVAPDSERSGFSSALTLDRPLKLTQIETDVWSVNGTPADCVYVALNGALDLKFDLVISGINSGANLGDDVFYSGTVGAALEGRALKHPALAISLAGSKVRAYQSISDYAVAAEWVRDFIEHELKNMPENCILNINIPDMNVKQGIKYTYQGQKQLVEPVKNFTDPRGREVSWIGLSGHEKKKTDANSEMYMSDFAAVEKGYISITPLQINLTHYQLLNQLNEK